MNQEKYEQLRQFYKEHFYQIEDQEEYKWEAVQHFQDTWNIDAEDFHAMLAEAIRKNGNLSASQKYNAGVGILMAAGKNPDATRQLFRDLFDETIDLNDRIGYFKESIQEIIKDCDGYKELNKQDVRAIILYLFLRYPEKYYLYKFDMYSEFVEMVEGGKLAGDDIQRGLDFLTMCDELKEIVLADKELLQMYEDRRNRYSFPSDNLLVQDIIYSVYYYKKPSLLKPIAKKAPSKITAYTFEKPMDAVLGEFDSWKTVNSNMAIKQTDKSFYDYKGSGVPKDVIWFFEASELEMGDRLDVILVYEGYEYSAYLKREAALGRTRIFWNTELGNRFNAYFETCDAYPLVMFQREGKDRYVISFMPGTGKIQDKVDDEPVDESKTVSWIFPANPETYNAIDAFNDLICVDWQQVPASKSIKVDDFVYIYISSPIKRIKFRCIVNKVDVATLEIEDEKYYVDKSKINEEGTYIELQAIEEYDDIEGLTYEKLKENGLAGQLNGRLRVTGKLLEHIEECHSEQLAIDRIYGGNDKLLQASFKRGQKVIPLPEIPDSSEEQEKQAKELDLELLGKIAKGREKKEPKKKEVTSIQITRDPYIAELAKRRAKGICQLCLQPAPFNKANGEPYLESHHIIWLANGGEDSIENTVALCPNCHRKMHVVASEEDVKTLKERSTSKGETDEI